MKIVVASDHGGFTAKEAIVKALEKLGLEVLDLGCRTEESCDYPDYARKVAQAVSQGRAEKGILVCGTGIGMSIAANKFPGVRAAVVWSRETAHLAGEHNWANVLCLSGRLFSGAQHITMIRAWLAAAFGEGRHSRRVKKIIKFESLSCKPRKS